jgi:8-oxo-dGTP pyrophosphatase MutT (NUDIX family)
MEYNQLMHVGSWDEIRTLAVPQYALRDYGAISIVHRGPDPANPDDPPEVIIAGYASPQVVDRERHLITKEALARDLPRFLAHPKYRNAMLLHSNVQVAEVLPYWEHPETGQRWETKVDDVGLFVVARVRTDKFRPKILDKVLADIEAGKLASFSISADAPFESRRYECADGPSGKTCFWVIDDVELYEVTLCETPVNQDARFTVISKAEVDELYASAFCADGSCPIEFKAGGVVDPAEPIKPIEARTATEQTDPRSPDRPDTGARNRAGGNARGHSRAVKALPPLDRVDQRMGVGPAQTGPQDTPAGYDGEEYYLNKHEDANGSTAHHRGQTGFDRLRHEWRYGKPVAPEPEPRPPWLEDPKPRQGARKAAVPRVFADLGDVLDRAYGELRLPADLALDVQAVLGTLQQSGTRMGIAGSFTRAADTWLAWSGEATQPLFKSAHVAIRPLLAMLREAAASQGLQDLAGDITLVNSELHKRVPLRGDQGVASLAALLTKCDIFSPQLRKAKFAIGNGYDLLQKGYTVGWLGTAQRALGEALDQLRLNVIENKDARSRLDEATLAALDVLYEDMAILADSMGLGDALEKFSAPGGASTHPHALQGDDEPELEIIRAADAEDTIEDVQEADALLEAVGERDPKPDDGADSEAYERDNAETTSHPENVAVVTGEIGKAVSGRPAVAGLAVLAGDTGRVLMIQRALDPDDPAAGTWEFPGGHIARGEAPLVAARREWEEETGRPLPPGRVVGAWRANDVYCGYVYRVASEDHVPVAGGRDKVVNPDDPGGDHIEALAWWDRDQLRGNPAVRPALADSLDKVFAALDGGIAKAFQGPVRKTVGAMDATSPQDTWRGNQPVRRGRNVDPLKRAGGKTIIDGTGFTLSKTGRILDDFEGKPRRFKMEDGPRGGDSADLDTMEQGRHPNVSVSRKLRGEDESVGVLGLVAQKAVADEGIFQDDESGDADTGVNPNRDVRRPSDAHPDPAVDEIKKHGDSDGWGEAHALSGGDASQRRAPRLVTPAQEAAGVSPHSRSFPEREERDSRGATDSGADSRGRTIKLQVGDQDAFNYGLGFARLFSRGMRDRRYKLALIKDDGGERQVIEFD